MTSRDKLYSQLVQIALSDFADIVEGTLVVDGKLRILLKDESFIDIWLSIKKKGIYAYHWERKMLMGRYIDIIISLTEKQKNCEPIQSIFIKELRKMLQKVI